MTGVQTCALQIYRGVAQGTDFARIQQSGPEQVGIEAVFRASENPSALGNRVLTSSSGNSRFARDQTESLGRSILFQTRKAVPTGGNLT